MITLPEKEYRILLAQCTASVVAGKFAMGKPIELAEQIIRESGITMDGAPSRPGVEPPKCTVCRQHIWPHEKTDGTGLRHAKCS